MKKVTFLIILVVIVIPCFAQTAADKSVSVLSFKVGDVPVTIPAPTKEFSEVGYDNREIMEVAVPPANRLVCAFVLKSDLPRLTRHDEELKLTRYAFVEVPRRGEYMDWKTSDFKKLIETMKGSLGNTISSSVEESEEELNHRLKSLDLNTKVRIGQPVQLGCFFYKENAFGFGMIVEYMMGNKAVKVVVGTMVLRVKERLLYAYLYAEYKDINTIKWVRKTMEQWSDTILKANR
ncbi:MAG: hypothetical protein LWW94_07795 [Candidatus Desulfofervidaceae bacterium]|nr:hypothetical protein [Candidatus Desulfofervidaceae bacterium]